MFRVQLSLVLVVGAVCLSWQASLPTDPSYTAGVVEFQPASSSLPPLERLNDNLGAYLQIISSDEAKETDIIVFPEATLNNADHLTYVPDPIGNIAPCNNFAYADFLQKLSCSAWTSNKYIVVNLFEKENCTDELQASRHDERPCAQNGLTTYNTNVVFDRNGTVISRYRKINLYYEPLNVTLRPEYGEFDTDFGVKFGHFICFDILFYTPATQLIDFGITDIIFPTMWFSELPFLTAVQTQQSWAYSYDVNLLAAGASSPLNGNTGTGIYAGNEGPLISVMKSTPERKLYVAKVPKKAVIRPTTNQKVRQKRATISHLNRRLVKRDSRLEGFNRPYIPAPEQQLQARQEKVPVSYINGVLVKRDPGLEDFITVPFDPTQLNTTVCHGSFCCHFTYRTAILNPPTGTKSYQYRLAAYNNLRFYDGIKPLGWSVCSLIACTDSTLESCGLTFDANETVSPNFVFQNILIDANFRNRFNALMMPNSVDDKLMPLPIGSFNFMTHDIGLLKNVRYALLIPRDNLLNFGIYTNYFQGKSSAYVSFVSKFLVFLTVSVLFVY